MTKKKTTKKKVAKRSTRKTPTKKATTKKKTQKKSARGKTAGGKKITRKKVTKKKATKSTSKKKTDKKKVTKKKTARKTAKKHPTKKKVTKKKVTKKKAAKATGKKKTAKKTTTKKKTTKKAGAAKAAKEQSGDGAAKKTKKKRQTKLDPKKRGRSVAEVASGVEADAQGYVFINGRRVRMISTAGKVLPKKPRAVTPAVEVDDKPIKFKKTRLTKKQLNHYRELLLIKRAELVGDLTSMEAAALRSSGGEISHMPIHMADIGSDTFDQDFNLGLAEKDRKHLREIDEALQRIEDRSYGVCQMTGKDIPKARLDAKPWAKYTIEAARIVESQQPA
jgi:DnaK suppressor protein